MQLIMAVFLALFLFTSSFFSTTWTDQNEIQKVNHPRSVAPPKKLWMYVDDEWMNECMNEWMNESERKKEGKYKKETKKKE